MFTKTKLALVGALVLGFGTVAQAGSKDDADRSGGYRVGPLSQSFAGANPASHRSLRGRMYVREMNGWEAYGFAPRFPAMSEHRVYHPVRGETYIGYHPVRGETYIGVQDEDFRRSNGG